MAPQIVMGLPQSVIPATQDTRDRLFANLGKQHFTSEALRKKGKPDSPWDPVTGSTANPSAIAMTIVLQIPYDKHKRLVGPYSGFFEQVSLPLHDKKKSEDAKRLEEDRLAKQPEEPSLAAKKRRKAGEEAKAKAFAAAVMQSQNEIKNWFANNAADTDPAQLVDRFAAMRYITLTIELIQVEGGQLETPNEVQILVAIKQHFPGSTNLSLGLPSPSSYANIEPLYEMSSKSASRI
ncbi:hypothetical protein DE146DRAFT_760885 [Phaeosphaeria sp. MPI-PUGE-AT-0046c]|nr:hypothetical protein DE146DRAFT_760885 [Phaeosphaeria sp. MPI-PUGE-AT-0046c]